MKIKKVTVTDEEGEVYEMPIENVSLRIFFGVQNLPDSNGFKEFKLNGANPFIITSGNILFKSYVNSKILEDDIRRLIDT